MNEFKNNNKIQLDAMNIKLNKIDKLESMEDDIYNMKHVTSDINERMDHNVTQLQELNKVIQEQNQKEQKKDTEFKNLKARGDEMLKKIKELQGELAFNEEDMKVIKKQIGEKD